MSAQTTPAHAKDVRVGFIDIQAAVTGTQEWKKEFVSFKTKFQKEKVAIATKEKNLKKLIENLNKQSMVLSPELKKKKEEALIKKKKEFEPYPWAHPKDKKKKKELTLYVCNPFERVLMAFPGSGVLGALFLV